MRKSNLRVAFASVVGIIIFMLLFVLMDVESISAPESDISVPVIETIEPTIPQPVEKPTTKTEADCPTDSNLTTKAPVVEKDNVDKNNTTSVDMQINNRFDREPAADQIIEPTVMKPADQPAEKLIDNQQHESTNAQSSANTNSVTESQANKNEVANKDTIQNKYNYTAVNEYLYVSADSLNVRIGPGANYDKIGKIERKTKVNRVGIVDNGWSEIVFKGKRAYVSSNHLSYSEINDAVFVDYTEIMFTTEDWVNLLVAPINESVPFVTFSQKNALLNVCGISEDGNWMKIKYGNRVGYLQSKYLAKEKLSPSIAEELATRKDMIGRLIIQDVNINVALFKQDLRHSSQAVVDQADSAAYLPDICNYFGFDLIADHRHQGFDGIKKSTVGKTIATINFGTYTEQYVCVDVFVGQNNKTDLVDANGKTLRGQNGGGICMYTCNYDDTITITFWQPV